MQGKPLWAPHHHTHNVRGAQVPAPHGHGDRQRKVLEMRLEGAWLGKIRSVFPVVGWILDCDSHGGGNHGAPCLEEETKIAGGPEVPGLP